MKAVILIAAFVAASGLAAAQDAVRRPGRWIRAEHATPRRLSQPSPAIAIPQQFSPPQEAYASFPSPAVGAGATAPTAPTAPSEPSPCQLRLAKLAVFKPLPVVVGPGECGANDAVLLESVVMPDETKVTLAPPATLRCPMAEQMALWLREDVAPAAASLETRPRALEDYDSYECRGRNGVRGAILSEHGRANAIDVRGFKLANGKMVELTDVNVAKDWRESLRSSACAHFTTVLGPGADGNHEGHIHLDLAPRHNGYKICEWDVREPVKQAESKPPGDKQPENKQAEKAKPEAEEKAAALAQPVPLPPPRPRTAAAENARASPAATAPDESRAHPMAGATKERPRRLARQRWRFRWWW